jgi:hypothetical protein
LGYRQEWNEDHGTFTYDSETKIPVEIWFDGEDTETTYIVSSATPDFDINTLAYSRNRDIKLYSWLDPLLPIDEIIDQIRRTKIAKFIGQKLNPEWQKIRIEKMRSKGYTIVEDDLSKFDRRIPSTISSLE